ncbi:hypothetical protein [Micromonospora echinospora]|uniref:hypothetical protein n=1 Tax=Micromonospora echinospora TaxID=1877 RepID=UPI00366AD0F7
MTIAISAAIARATGGYIPTGQQIVPKVGVRVHAGIRNSDDYPLALGESMCLRHLEESQMPLVIADAIRLRWSGWQDNQDCHPCHCQCDT